MTGLRPTAPAPRFPFMVELEADTGIRDLVEVEAVSSLDARLQALDTRNLPSSWRVVTVARVGGPVAVAA